ncbi:hypothetical protein [Corallibacter sp.]
MTSFLQIDAAYKPIGYLNSVLSTSLQEIESPMAIAKKKQQALLWVFL